MKRNTKKSKLFKRGPISGFAVSIIMILAMTFICAVMSEKGMLTNDILELGIIAVCAVSGFAGGMISADGEFKNVLIFTALLAGIKAASSAVGEGSILSDANISVMAAILISALAGGVTSLKSKRRKRR